MFSSARGNWTVAATTFVLWGAVAASAVYWGMKLTSRAGPPAAPPPPRAAANADPVAVARLMGAGPTVAAAAAAAPSLASRFVLTGVVASASRHGAALIAVDGRPPKPFRVGAPVDQDLVLQSVDSRTAVLASTANGPAAVTLELPQRK
jgi:general secretion pathway protein C